MLTAKEVIQRRSTLLGVFRMLSLLALPIGIVAFYSWLTEGLRDGDFFDISYYHGRILLTFSGFAVPAIAWFLGPILAKWFVPVPSESECPRCGYKTAQSDARCSECGLILGRSVALPCPACQQAQPRAAANASTTSQTTDRDAEFPMPPPG